MWLQQLARRYLERKGWIVFWLDEDCRQCQPNRPMGCWLELYLQDRKRNERRI